MVRNVLVAVVLLASSTYAGTCGEVYGSVRCSYDVGHNPTLDGVDKAILSHSSGSALPDASSIPGQMATYPPDLKSQGVGRRPSPQSPDQEESNRNTFKMWIPSSVPSSGSVR